MDEVQAPDLIDIRADLTKHKKAARLLTNRVDATPHPPPPMLLLVVLTIDVDSSVPNFYTSAPNIKETNIIDMDSDLEP